MQHMGVTGRRGRLLVLVSSAINIDNNRAAGWVEIALELVAVAICMIHTEVALSSRAETTGRLVAYHGVP